MLEEFLPHGAFHSGTHHMTLIVDKQPANRLQTNEEQHDGANKVDFSVEVDIINCCRYSFDY